MTINATDPTVTAIMILELMEVTPSSPVAVHNEITVQTAHTLKLYYNYYNNVQIIDIGRNDIH